jgi:hypothetical protein
VGLECGGLAGSQEQRREEKHEQGLHGGSVMEGASADKFKSSSEAGGGDGGTTVENENE